VPAHTRLLVLDLDYLVFDCAPVKIQALRQSLIAFADSIPQSVRLPDAFDAEEGYREHGFRWTQFLEIGLDEERLSELQRVYAIQEERLLDSGAGSVFPGLTELLERCRRQGLQLAIGADASRDYLMSVSDRHRLHDLFSLALCTEEFGVGSADEMLTEIIHHHEVNPSETVVLGTRPAMFQAAHRLDVVTIGCGWAIQRHDGLAEADFRSLTLSALEPALEEADDLSSRYLA
jgi:phosphoglycolate phosphatase-like HAD superfamily hydrolase